MAATEFKGVSFEQGLSRAMVLIIKQRLRKPKAARLDVSTRNCKDRGKSVKISDLLAPQAQRATREYHDIRRKEQELSRQYTSVIKKHKTARQSNVVGGTSLLSNARSHRRLVIRGRPHLLSKTVTYRPKPLPAKMMEERMISWVTQWLHMRRPDLVGTPFTGSEDMAREISVEDWSALAAHVQGCIEELESDGTLLAHKEEFTLREVKK